MAVQQAPGLWRTDLQRQDLGVPGREVIQARVDIGPEAPFVQHTHPGEELDGLPSGDDRPYPAEEVPVLAPSSQRTRSSRSVSSDLDHLVMAPVGCSSSIPRSIEGASSSTRRGGCGMAATLSPRPVAALSVGGVRAVRPSAARPARRGGRTACAGGLLR
jgi:hypothetical protein